MIRVRFLLALFLLLGMCAAFLRHVPKLPILINPATRAQFVCNHFVWKLRCVTLSGGFSRWVLGHRRMNGVYLLPCGQLEPLTRRINVPNAVDQLVAMRDALGKAGVKLIYVQIPDKESLDGRSIPKGYGETFFNCNCDGLLSGVHGVVDTIDLRPAVSATEEDVRTNFFRTDHHWNFTGAFKAFEALVSGLAKELGSALPENLPQLDRRNWILVPIPRQDARFMGSRGRRTGPWFIGYDRMDYLVPRFDTELSVAVLDRYGQVTRRSGPFAKALINEGVIADPATCYEDLAYDVYLGDHAVVEISNPHAPVDRTVCIVKDSFVQPLVAWLSTVFTKVVAIDPRYDREDLVTRLVSCHPHLVLMMCLVDKDRKGSSVKE